jgi:integrase
MPRYGARVVRNRQPSRNSAMRKVGYSGQKLPSSKADIFRKWQRIGIRLLSCLIATSQTSYPQKSPSTIPDQIRQLRWWIAHLGHFLLADITPSLIAEYRDKLRRDRANSTVNRYLAALSHAYTVAVREWQWCEDNPVRKISKLREPRGRLRFLSEEEFRRLRATCLESRNPYLHNVVVLAVSTGARKMELLGLRWPDVDLKRSTLTFHETKNGETRSVPLTGYALDILERHAKSRRFNTDLALQHHFSASTKFAHVKSRFCGRKQRGKAAFCTPINPCARRACSRSVAVGVKS